MSKAVQKIEIKTPSAPTSDAVFSLIERISTDPSVSIDRVEQAFAFYQKVQADQARKAFTQDFIAMQSKLEPVRKAGNNPQTKSKDATFEALDAAVRPVLSEHGFGVTFNTAPGPSLDYVKVLMTLMHKDGHSEVFEADMPADGKGAKGGDVMTKTHAVGSAMSYGKRYVMGNALNIPTTKDDDGNRAANTGETITEDEFTVLANLMKNKGVPLSKFLEVENVEALSDLPRSRFAQAKAKLAAVRRPVAP